MSKQYSYVMFMHGFIMDYKYNHALTLGLRKPAPSYVRDGFIIHYHYATITWGIVILQ